MENIIKKYIKGDYVVWLVFIILCFVSALEIFSASSYLAHRGSSYLAPILHHVTFLILGLVVIVVVHMIPYKIFRIFSYLLLLVSWGCLFYVLLGKGKSANDAARWIDLGFFQFQPSELAKLALIIVVADLIDRSQSTDKKNEDSCFYLILAVSAVTCGLIFTENLSTAVLLLFIVFVMMFIGKIPWKKLLALVIVSFALLGIGYGLVKIVPEDRMPSLFKRAYTWENRIEHFVAGDENKYVITDENFQVVHGQIAIARGGVIGVMPGNSVERDFLPGAFSDFVYSIIVEELGLVGGCFVIAMYLILLYRAGRIASKCNDIYPALLVIGLTLMIVIQAFVSMAVSVHLGPVTGQPLPLVSRGGTSILITCVYLGIILSISRYNQKEQKKREESELINKGVENEETVEVLN